MIWDFQSAEQQQVNKLTGALEISGLVAQILLARGFSRPEDARRFLESGPSDMHDPYLMADMEKAVERLQRALRTKEKVFVFGDYDVDGVTSIAAFSTLLGAAEVPFQTHQPDRMKEGYGLSEKGVELARQSGSSLLVVLDCGTEASAAVRKAGEYDIDVLIIDHHRLRGPLPSAFAVLNPNRPDCSYPFKELTAVGVVFKFLQAGEEVWGIPLPRERLWQLAALGTVADVAPLVDENRIIVKTGLAFLRQNRDPDFRALVQVSGLDPRKLQAGHISFQLAPRLNAAGRMGTPEVGCRLLESTNLDEIHELVRQLDTLNRSRRALQSRIFEEADVKIQAEAEKYQGNVIVVEGEGWSKGIVGIVAAKVQEKYYRPAVVIALEGEVGVGSARSIPGFNLYEALGRCSHLLDKFGGHKYAAGITVRKDQIAAFRCLVNQVAAEMLGEEGLIPRLSIDARINLGEVSFELLGELEQLEPFGIGNPRPVFLSSNVSLRGSPRVMGREGHHLKLWLEEGGVVQEGVGWNMARRIGELNKRRLDVVYQLRENTWRNQRKLQLVLKDFRPAESG